MGNLWGVFGNILLQHLITLGQQSNEIENRRKLPLLGQQLILQQEYLPKVHACYSYFLFSIRYLLQSIFGCLTPLPYATPKKLMSEFEPWTSGVRRNRSSNYSPCTFLLSICVLGLAKATQHPFTTISFFLFKQGGQQLLLAKMAGEEKQPKKIKHVLRLFKKVKFCGEKKHIHVSPQK